MSTFQIQKYIIAVPSSLLTLVGIIGNLIVLLDYCLRYKRSPARVYILFLASIDLSMCIFGLPYHIIDLTNPYTYTNRYLYTQSSSHHIHSSYRMVHSWFDADVLFHLELSLPLHTYVHTYIHKGLCTYSMMNRYTGHT